MLQYGFPWPEMLNCEKYAEDHDMCIRSLSPRESQLSIAACPFSSLSPCLRLPFQISITRVSLAARSAPTKTSSTTSVARRSVLQFPRIDHPLLFVVLKARLGSVNESSLSVRKARSLKRNDRRRSLLRDTVIHLSDRGNSSCSCELPDQDNGERFLIMANQNGGDSRLIANLILPWKRDKVESAYT
jgi:hypothetical protein